MLTVDNVMSHPDLLPILRRQAASLLAIGLATPKVGSIFGTQQRYLMAQVALSMFFSSPDGTMRLSRYLEQIVEWKIASRNTAHDFVREMEKYKMVTSRPSQDDKRARPLIVPDEPVRLIGLWLAVHLQALDEIDGGRRAAALERDPRLLRAVHPRIVTRLLQSRHSTAQNGTFSLFTWMNDGGLVMDKMIATVRDFEPLDGRIVTGIATLVEIAEALRVTKTHLSRKMAQAERDGSVGWLGRRGASPLWLSPAFLAEYVDYQADKLARIDEAFSETVAAA